MIILLDPCCKKILIVVSSSIIPQRYSWGELQVTRDIFQRILIYLEVSASLLNVVLEFGSKIRHELPRGSTTSFMGEAYSNSRSASDTREKFGTII